MFNGFNFKESIDPEEIGDDAINLAIDDLGLAFPDGGPASDAQLSTVQVKDGAFQPLDDEFLVPTTIVEDHEKSSVLILLGCLEGLIR